MDPIYLDHAASSPLRPEVRAAMREVEERAPGNPSSPHRFGREARARLEEARRRVAGALGVEPGAVVFVGGGTESDNLAILGWSRSVRRSGRRPRLLHSAIEHSAVAAAARQVEAEDGQVEIFPVASDGSVQLDQALDRLGMDAAETGPLEGRNGLVSCLWVSHETGLILPIREVVEWAGARGFQVHVDGVQGVGRLDAAPILASVDLFSLSARKLAGPPRMGILVARAGVDLQPILFGGGQERGLRPGTEDVAGAVGTAVAVEAAVTRRDEEWARLTALRESLELRLREGIPDLVIHGSQGERAPHILNVGIPGVPLDLLPGALDLEGVAVSAGSACQSGTTGPSPVLTALYGGDHARHTAPLRISLGWNTRASEVEEAGSVIIRVVEGVRRAFGAPL
ncbi:MAG: cysteine desulfurase [Gemmatimonadales bacterium]|nr:MAG: cysteine desulfurase [Gemmatimonadales bacterium]